MALSVILALGRRADRTRGAFARPAQDRFRPHPRLRRLACGHRSGTRRCAARASRPGAHRDLGLAGGLAVDRRAFPARCAVCLLSCRGQSRRRGGKPLRARLWPARAGATARAALLPALPRRDEPRRPRRRRLHLPVHLGIHVAFFVGAGDGARSGQGERARRLRLSGDGELRHARALARLRPARRA